MRQRTFPEWYLVRRNKIYVFAAPSWQQALRESGATSADTVDLAIVRARTKGVARLLWDQSNQLGTYRPTL